MTGLVPAIHVFKPPLRHRKGCVLGIAVESVGGVTAWMAG